MRLKQRYPKGVYPSTLNPTQFILKGKIASTSPYLLISGKPKDWPKGCDKKDIDFADFHMIDAIDLVKVYNSVSQEPLSSKFSDNFEFLRKKRNSFVHTITNNEPEVKAIEVLKEILFFYSELFADKYWVDERKEFLIKDAHSQIHSSDDVLFRLAFEFFTLGNNLTNSEFKKYFFQNKKQRSYICPTCTNFDESEYLNLKTARLQPNHKSSTTVRCYVCREDHSVKRKKCCNANCKGNVISVEYEVCLTCSGVN